MKTTLITICISLFGIFSACQNSESANTQQDKEYLLGTIFPIENIQRISVTNNSGTHILTSKELTILKGELNNAKYAGGLLEKPGPISLTIQFKNNTVAKPGTVYASTGSVHFDGAIDEFGEAFSGSFHLPTKLNFDNYK